MGKVCCSTQNLNYQVPPTPVNDNAFSLQEAVKGAGGKVFLGAIMAFVWLLISLWRLLALFSPERAEQEKRRSIWRSA